MISAAQMQLNIHSDYIRHVREMFPAESPISNRYLFILQIRQWQLKRKMLRPGTVADLATLRTGHHEAECLSFVLDKGSNKALVKEIQNILQLIALELFREITEIESRHPENKAEFACDREDFRLRWNHFVEEQEDLEAATQY